jgi:hypothetical protein
MRTSVPALTVAFTSLPTAPRRKVVSEMAKKISGTERNYNHADRLMLRMLSDLDNPKLLQAYNEARDWAYELGRIDGKEELTDLVTYEMKQSVVLDKERWAFYVP